MKKILKCLRGRGTVPSPADMFDMRGLTVFAAFSFLLSAEAPAASPDQATVGDDGTVHLPAHDVPLSNYMSQEARNALIKAAHAPPTIESDPAATIPQIRESVDKRMRAKVEHLESIYPVTIEEHRVGGVRAHIVTPKDGVSHAHRDRVLINLHGGAFEVGAVWHGLVESIPIASVGKFKVVTVDYRMAPEYGFPAASEDVAAVYSALLEQYHARNIGIYGCSAGGSLTAMAVAWLQKEDKPLPGAIALLSAGAFAGFAADPSDMGSWGGDSRFVAPPLVGKKQVVRPMPYLSKADLHDPLVSPGVSPATLMKFPPTLLVSGTRAYDMSAVVQTQRELTKVGVEADMHLWDGMGHCFFLDENLPESREAYDVVARFFDRRLGRSR